MVVHTGFNRKSGVLVPVGKAICGTPPEFTSTQVQKNVTCRRCKAVQKDEQDE